MNLIDLIDKVFVEREKRKSESHHPSSADDCSRKLWYTRNIDDKQHGIVESNPIEIGAYWKFEIGNSLHSMIGNLFKESGVETAEEVEVKYTEPGLKYPISGRIDNVIVDPETKEKVGVEIKTSFGRGIVEIQRTQRPKPEHITQVAIYMTLTEIKSFYLFYLGRDNGYRCQFHIKYVNDTTLSINGSPYKWSFRKYIDKWKAIETATKPLPKDFRVAIKKGEIKDSFTKNGIDYDSDWQCMYCKFKDFCWSSEKRAYQDSDNSESFKERP